MQNPSDSVSSMYVHVCFRQIKVPYHWWLLYAWHDSFSQIFCARALCCPKRCFTWFWLTESRKMTIRDALYRYVCRPFCKAFACLLAEFVGMYIWCLLTRLFCDSWKKSSSSENFWRIWPRKSYGEPQNSQYLCLRNCIPYPRGNIVQRQRREFSALS